MLQKQQDMYDSMISAHISNDRIDDDGDDDDATQTD